MANMRQESTKTDIRVLNSRIVSYTRLNNQKNSRVVKVMRDEVKKLDWV